jgi:hypothetical protein
MEGETMKRWGVGILGVVFVLALGASGAAAQTYNATVGGLGGVWYTMFTGIAELVKEKDPGVIIRVVPGGGLIAVQKDCPFEDCRRERKVFDSWAHAQPQSSFPQGNGAHCSTARIHGPSNQL